MQATTRPNRGRWSFNYNWSASEKFVSIRVHSWLIFSVPSVAKNKKALWVTQGFYLQVQLSRPFDLAQDRQRKSWHQDLLCNLCWSFLRPSVPFRQNLTFCSNVLPWSCFWTNTAPLRFIWTQSNFLVFIKRICSPSQIPHRTRRRKPTCRHIFLWCYQMVQP